MGITFNSLYFGHPIYVATKEWQKRKHHKKRINKKWLKRYGTWEMNMMPHGEIELIDGAIWMTKRTYEVFKQQVLRR